MPDHEDSLGGETFSGEEQQDPAEQSLGDGATMGGDTAAHSLGDQSTFGDANVDDELFDDGMKLEDLSERYTEEGVLGKGGMGEVILATDTRLGRKVAIKRILGKAARSKTAVARFLTEAQSMAELSHPNIVQIHDYGRSADGPFLVMECIQGGSLLDKCKAGPIELDEAVNIFGQLCDGLAKAHAANIIHRDIKPANVLMTEDGVPKLTDFGLAKDDTADTGKTMEGAVIGTLDFMPPEQRQAAEFTDHRSDLWSLAATFYQMLTGEPPRVIDLDSVPPSIRAVLAKSLKSKKEDRFQSAMEMREAFLQAHSGKMDRSRTLTEGECPQCATPNPPHGKFCIECSAVLQVQCLECEVKIQIWNRACGDCGAQQTPLVDKALADLKQIHDQAESLLADLEFDTAVEKAAVIASETDSRLQQFATWHEDFSARIESSRTSEHARLAQLLQEALTHEQACDYEAGLQTLGQVAPSLKQTTVSGNEDTAEEIYERLAIKQVRLKELERIVRERLTEEEHKGLLPLVDELLALKPDRPEIRKLRAQLLKREEFITFLKNGDYESALLLDPDNSKALAMKKTADIEASLASGDYESALSLDPNSSKALAMKKTADIEASLASGDYETALSLDPNHSESLAMKKKDADIKRAFANSDYETILSLDSGHAAALAMKREADIHRALNGGDYETALSLDPRHVESLAMKREADIHKALAGGDYETALSLDPNHSESLAMKKKDADIERALANSDYETALSLDPRHVESLAMKREADIHRALAGGDYETAFSLDPNNLEAITMEKDADSKKALSIIVAAVFLLIFICTIVSWFVSWFASWFAIIPGTVILLLIARLFI